MPPDPTAMTREVRLLSTTAILGYGFPEASLRAGLARHPHFIGVDGGSVGYLLCDSPDGSPEGKAQPRKTFVPRFHW